ncbi:MAG: MFS transporter [Betaproteobacteria bacterium]|jgi:MFS family permease|nr:MFS transporter [Betaproteobacteria bacterium]
MNTDSAAPLRPPPSLAYLVFTLTFSHAMSVSSMLVLPAIAPVVAAEYGIDPSLVGYHISVVSIGLIVSLVLFSGLSRRIGSARAAQIGQCLVAAGMMCAILPSAAFLLPGSLVIGIGFGLLAPPASALMMRFAPPARRNLVFSIQQTSVPLGGVIAALVAPLVAVSVGWRWAFMYAIVMLGIAIVLLQIGRPSWDDDRDPSHRALARNPFDSARSNWRDRKLRLLSFAGMSFCWAQFCVVTFAVVACVAVLGMSIVQAGLVLVAAQVASTVGRMAAGWIADRIGSAGRVLTWMSWTMLVLSIGFFWLSPSWPLWFVYVMFAAIGLASGAWAGILMAEVGQQAPPGRVAAVVGGTLLYVNIGKFTGPAVFSATYALTHSYNIAFALLAVPALVAIACLRAQQRQAAT